MADGTAPKTLQIALWGVPGLVLDGQRLHIGARKALALMALLALDGRAPRDRLAQQLWPDLDTASARRNLRREVFRLREAGLALVESASGALDFPLGTAVDVAQFRQATKEGDDEAALASSQVSLLAGLDGVAGAAFDERLLQWRNQLTQERGHRFVSAVLKRCQPAVMRMTCRPHWFCIDKLWRKTVAMKPPHWPPCDCSPTWTSAPTR